MNNFIEQYNITKKLLKSKASSNHGVVIKKEFSTNFWGTGKERTERELDNLLPMLYLLRLVGASPEIGGSRKKDRKGKRPYDLLLVLICT